MGGRGRRFGLCWNNSCGGCLRWAGQTPDPTACAMSPLPWHYGGLTLPAAFRCRFSFWSCGRNLCCRAVRTMMCACFTSFTGPPAHSGPGPHTPQSPAAAPRPRRHAGGPAAPRTSCLPWRLWRTSAAPWGAPAAARARERFKWVKRLQGWGGRCVASGHRPICSGTKLHHTQQASALAAHPLCTSKHTCTGMHVHPHANTHARTHVHAC